MLGGNLEVLTVLIFLLPFLLLLLFPLHLGISGAGFLMWECRENDSSWYLAYAIQNRLLGVEESGWSDREDLGHPGWGGGCRIHGEQGELEYLSCAIRRRMVAENKRGPCTFSWMPAVNQLPPSSMLWYYPSPQTQIPSPDKEWGGRNVKWFLSLYRTNFSSPISWNEGLKQV